MGKPRRLIGFRANATRADCQYDEHLANAIADLLKEEDAPMRARCEKCNRETCGDNPDASCRCGGTMQEIKPSKYPECDKLAAIHEQSQAIGEFLEWLQSGQGHDFGTSVQLAWYPKFKFSQAELQRAKREWSREKGDGPEFAPIGVMDVATQVPESTPECNDNDEDEQVFKSNNLQPFPHSMEPLLARFFNIDLAKVEAERRQMLKEISEINKPNDFFHGYPK